VIEIDEIEETQLGDSEAVQVKDTAGNEFTTFFDDEKKMLLEEKDHLIGEVCDIGFTVYKGQYLSFHSIGSPEIDHDEEDVVREEISIEELVGKDGHLSSTDRQITRQSAAHDASRIVGGMIADGRFRKEYREKELREAVQEELEYWTEFFKTHHRTGEWESDSE